MTVLSFSNANTGDYTVTTAGTSTDTTTETGSASTTYSLLATASSTFSNIEHGNALTGGYTLDTASTDQSTTTRTATGLSLIQTDTNTGSVETTGNHLTGDFTAIAIGSDTLTTDQITTATSVSVSLHQVNTSDSTLTNVGNDFTGAFDTTETQQNTVTMVQMGYNTSGTFTLVEDQTDNPTIEKWGNGVDGIQTLTETGEETNDFYEYITPTSGRGALLEETEDINDYFLTGTDNANTGDSTYVKVGDDNYDMEMDALSGTPNIIIQLSGEDTYTQTTDSNSQTGAFTQVTTGSGTYENDTVYGPGGSTSGNTSFTTTETASSRDASVTTTTTGFTRYDALNTIVTSVNHIDTFISTSDAASGTLGFADFSPVGLPVLIDRASVPSGMFSGVGDEEYKYCFSREMLTAISKTEDLELGEAIKGGSVYTNLEADPEGKPRHYYIERVFENPPARIWHVVVKGKPIRTTANHPFYLRKRGWVAACKIKSGDELRTLDGGWIAVEKVEDSGVSEVVYNLQIAKARTYFVRAPGCDVAVLVHNTSVSEQFTAIVGRMNWAIEHPMTAYGAVTQAVMDAWKGNPKSTVRQLRSLSQLSMENYNPGAGNEYLLGAKSIGQGFANAANGVQDVTVQIINTPAELDNAIYRLVGSDKRAFIIVSKDWSAGRFVDDSEVHKLGKFLAGNGTLLVVSGGTTYLFKGAAGVGRLINSTNTALTLVNGTTNGLNAASDFRSGNLKAGAYNTGGALFNVALGVVGMRGVAAGPTARQSLSLPLAPESQGLFRLTATFENVPQSMWSQFPEGVPRPTGLINLLEGNAYAVARRAAYRANRPLSRAFALGPASYEIHEIVPVKYGGSPTALSNKVALLDSLHDETTAWFGRLQRALER